MRAAVLVDSGQPGRAGVRRVRRWRRPGIELLGNRGPVHRRQPVRLAQIGDLHEASPRCPAGIPADSVSQVRRATTAKVIAHTPVTSRPGARTYRHDRAGGRAEVHRSPGPAAVTHTIVTRRYQTRTNASLCQGAWFLAFLAAECGRRLAVPPGRSSSLRCGRSTWTCGFADGGVAAIAECPGVPGAAGLPGPGLAAVVVGWWRDPGVACPKSRRLGCEPAALVAESFPCCPPGSSARAAARCASARRRANTASLTCRFSARRASLGG